jgi:hypothetical protein
MLQPTSAREDFLEAVPLVMNLEGQMELSGGRKGFFFFKKKKQKYLCELILKTQKKKILNEEKKCGLE